MAILKCKDNEITKDGRCWYYTYTYYDNNGNLKRSKSKKYLTKKEAQKEEAIYLINNKDNKNKMLFEIVAECYFRDLEKTRKASTIYTYKKDYNKHLKDFFDKINIYTIDTKIIKKWAIEMENKGLSINYLNKLHTLLRNIFDYAIKNYELYDNPVKMFGRFQSKNDIVVQDSEKIRYITKEEFDKFISVVEDPMYHCLFLFAYYTGCRKGEMLALNWNDIDFNSDIIYINKTLHQEIKGEILITSNKTNKNRRIKMSKTLKEELIKYKELVKQYTDYQDSWYVFGNSIYLSTTSLDRNKSKYFKLSGVNEITMHEFRHSHVSLLINEYVKSGNNDMAKFFLMMSDRMGHSIEVMQKTYMHLLPTIQNDIVDILDNL